MYTSYDIYAEIVQSNIVSLVTLNNPVNTKIELKFQFRIQINLTFNTVVSTQPSIW